MSFASVEAVEQALQSIGEPDSAVMAAARRRQDSLTKPRGSLGRLEDIALFMAGWQGRATPRLDTGKIVVFAGNHGVAGLGVSAFPVAVTGQMVANFKAGGAAINALAAVAGLALDVVALDLDQPTADFTLGPALSVDECLAAMSAGARTVESGLDLIVLGEMGIGNSTAAAALAARSFGGSATQWTGPGTGLDGEGIARKIAVVEAGLARHRDAPATPFETLRRLGGREIAAIAGAVLRARQLRIPVLLDGFICCAAIAPFASENPAITAHCLAGHRSAEPGHIRLLDRLGLRPLLDLDMRLGEASGAALAATLVRAALATHSGMASFAEAGVEDRE
ncbi:nicotinate-nucleotide--dimethylbenzimidazole phosphoribosyltransferase [Rhizorhabdus phycosphaerae]|uniref:nicotinate-nucleotide--dimethylbenzimidazole phosphoribosyltransferase n=1 Tax=Rhizorhabdus phycosphaerae TaxID=2711156 RepID=UPI0013EC455D|nr:nicotinate-nucleotide--dimethylbenzimidazole phosphoribosyltransferase [Rhizorhabdus phycosphaerae]